MASRFQTNRISGLVKIGLILSGSLLVGCSSLTSDSRPPASAAAAAPVAVVGEDFRQSAVEILTDYKDYQNGNTGWLYTLEKGLHAYSTITNSYADAREVLKQFTATKGQPWVDRLLAVLQKKPDVPLETKMAALATLSEHVAQDKGP